jgi:hypothetical protein
MTTIYLYGQVHRESLVYGLILFCTNLCQVLQLREDCSDDDALGFGSFVCLFVC